RCVARCNVALRLVRRYGRKERRPGWTWVTRYGRPADPRRRVPRKRHPPRNELRPLVRRAKVSIFSGCNSRPVTVAPAGSNRSGSGGNETAEAFGGKGRRGGPASRQAV